MFPEFVRRKFVINHPTDDTEVFPSGQMWATQEAALFPKSNAGIRSEVLALPPSGLQAAESPG